MAARTWTCTRVTNGVRCGAKNRKIKLICETCGKKRPPTKRPAHMQALDIPYERYVRRYGEQCGICGCGPSPDRRLDRDHDHATGQPRGLLCQFHNRFLPRRATPELLRAAADYLERASSKTPLATDALDRRDRAA